ncbi:MAG TPA: EamA family transporter [Steroidobacteraceae bacterium]|jgi:drug/metabolite transporter (DMT)-like permease|nr:EamA family transporter [Steroidobacteraceae bacterium]
MSSNGMSRPAGMWAALGGAALFGLGTPLAKLLVARVSPLMLAALLYLGCGVGLLVYRRIRRAPAGRLAPGDTPWWIAAIAFGGVLAPALLMWGLRGTSAFGASLLLNAETVFTVLIARLAFREHIGLRIAAGIAAIVAGAVIVGWRDAGGLGGIWPSLAIAGACLAWAIDNNLTRRVALADASWLASMKGLAAGSVNLVLALAQGSSVPPWPTTAFAMAVGLVSYGASLTLFVQALRSLGTARTAAYFAVAPFIGAAAAAALGAPVSMPLVAAGALMAIGVWLHAAERHEHAHTHAPLEHDHTHVHDEHHGHLHDPPVPPGVRHSHRHRHEPMTHRHAHFPDAHHRHPH